MVSHDHENVGFVHISILVLIIKIRRFYFTWFFMILKLFYTLFVIFTCLNQFIIWVYFLTEIPKILSPATNFHMKLADITLANCVLTISGNIKEKWAFLILFAGKMSIFESLQSVMMFHKNQKNKKLFYKNFINYQGSSV